MGKQQSRRPELLREIQDQFTDVFTKKGLSGEDAATYARSAVDALVYMLGGSHVYFPFGHLEKTHELHEQIRRDFTGHNHAELIAKYRMSFNTIYKILRTQKGRV